MNELKERNSNIDGIIFTSVKEHMMKGQSLCNIEPQTYRNLTISPWAGEEYYTKVKRQIQQQPQKKRSSTAKSIRYKVCDNSQVPKLSTVQLDVEQPQVILKKQRGKYFQSKISNKLINHQNAFQQPQKDKECRTTEFSIKEADTIHQRKFSSWQIQRAAGRLHTQEQKQSFAPPSLLPFQKDKRGLLFFFQTKQGSNIVNRQRMVMKIRNIEKSKAQRVYTQGG